MYRVPPTPSRSKSDDLSLSLVKLRLTSDRFTTGEAFLREQSRKTVRTVRMIIPRCESLAGERILTIRARETFPMPEETSPSGEG